LFDHPGMQRSTLNKSIFRIIFQHAELIRNGPGIFSNRLVDRPQPRGIHMGMPGQCRHRSICSVFCGKRRLHDRTSLPERIDPVIVFGILGRIQNHAMNFRQYIHDFRPAKRFFIRHFHQLNQYAKITDKICHIPYFFTDFNRSARIHEIASFSGFKRQTSDNIMAGIKFDCQFNRFGRIGFSTNRTAKMISVAGHHNFGRKRSARLIVNPQQSLISPHRRLHIKRLSG